MFKLVRGQAGDTLVEVVMAVAIISGVLASAYAVANNSYRIGVQSRERIEAVNLAQQQAELLRAARDQAIVDDPNADGSNVLPGPVGSTFRMVPGPPISNVSCPPSGCPVGPSNRYSLRVTSLPTGQNIPGSSSPAREGRTYTIRVEWVRIGSGGGASGTEQTEVVLTLVDRRIDKTPIDCDEVEKCS